MDPVEEDTGLGIGARIAGVILVLNAISVLFAEIALNLPASGLASSVVDLILGALLIVGVRKVIPFCLLRVILGGILYLGWSLFAGDMITALGQVALSGAVLGLLVGTPSPARVWASGAVAAIFLGYVALLLHAGTRARSSEALLASDEIQVIDQGDIEGLGFEYYLKVPNEQWFLRSEEATKRENPVADRWLVRPDRDAHFIVIAERFPR